MEKSGPLLEERDPFEANPQKEPLLVANVLQPNSKSANQETYEQILQAKEDIINQMKLRINRLEFSNRSALHYFDKIQTLSEELIKEHQKITRQFPSSDKRSSVPAKPASQGYYITEQQLHIFGSKDFQVSEYSQYGIHCLNLANMNLPIQEMQSKMPMLEPLSSEKEALSLLDKEEEVFVPTSDSPPIERKLEQAQEAIQNQTVLELLKTVHQERKFYKENYLIFKYKYEKIFAAKELLSQEIEDLTATLFEQANSMVADESRIRDRLEVENRLLSGKLQETLKLFSHRETDVQEMKRKLQILEKKVRRKASLKIRQQIDVASESEESRYESTMSINDIQSLESVDNAVVSGETVYVDNISLSEFKEYIQFISQERVKSKEFAKGKEQATRSREYSGGIMTSMQSQPLIRKILAEEIDSALSSFTFKQFNKKKLLDVLFRHGCLIETISTINKTKCAACGITRECEFTIKFDSGESYCMDRFCTNKIKAIDALFKYLSSLPLNASVSPLLELFRQFVYLRRNIFNSKVASMTRCDDEDVLTTLKILY